MPYLEINLREKNKLSCAKNLEFRKFLFTINNCKSSVKVLRYKGRSLSEFLTIRGMGKKKYTEEDYELFEKINRRIKKVIFIEKALNINFDYDAKYFLNNEIAINLVYCDLKKQNYKFPIPLKVDVYTEDYNKNE